ncbi:hypothetical protein QL285_028780 [Trifolium repens]|nr:hypothetical protein QL285_028780 [Trifolium repens]
MAGLWVICAISLWRDASPPWRNPGSDLNNSPGEQVPAMAKFFSPEPSFRHECSPAFRHGEFIQKGPCFTKIIEFMLFHLHSSFKTVQKHKTYNIKWNGGKFGS